MGALGLEGKKFGKGCGEGEARAAGGFNDAGGDLQAPKRQRRKAFRNAIGWRP
jgi:hypothetical protein